MTPKHTPQRSPQTAATSAEIAAREANEPILQESHGRFVLFPIKHDRIWEMYKTAEACFWTTEEIDLGADLTDWHKL
ncbi:MAG: ribonucleotide-diphosphate reductase subunit beta, partial [Bacteroidota bacterium]